MYQTNLAFKNENEILTTEDWNYFVSEISKVFRFTQIFILNFLSAFQYSLY